MERSLLSLSFALGGVVWLCGFLSSASWPRAGSGPTTTPLPRFWLITSLALPIIVFLATLPAAPPMFAPGHAMGTGFLLGGLLGLLAVWVILRALAAAEKGEVVSSAAVIAGPIGLALAVSAVPSLFMRDNLVDAICGAAIGWLCSVILALCGLAPQWQTRSKSAAGMCLAFTAGSGVLFCSLAGLGELRGLVDLVGKSTTLVHWAAPALAFEACLVVVLLLVLLPPALALRIPLVPRITGWIERRRDSDEARASARRTWRMAFCAIAALVVGRLVASRFTEQDDALWKTKSALLKPIFALLGPSPMFHVIAIGVLASIVICWVVRDQSRQVGYPLGAARVPQPNTQPNFLAALTLAAAGMLAFQAMGGFGLCLLLSVLLLNAALICAAVLPNLHEQVTGPAAAAMPASNWELTAATDTVRLVLFGTVLALYRFFSARFEGELRGVSLTDHYALFGVLFGAALPPALTAYFGRVPAGSTDSDASRLARTVVTGLLTLVVPTVIVAFWGAKCALALLIGLAVSVLFEGSLLSALFALAMALALVQWTHHVLPLAQLTRDQKVNFLGWTTAVAIMALLIAEYSGRWRTPGQRQNEARQTKGGAQ